MTESTPELEQLVTQQFIESCKRVHSRLAALPDGTLKLPSHRFAAFMLPGETIIFVGIRPASANEWLVYPFSPPVIFMTLANMLINLAAGTQVLATKFNELMRGQGSSPRGKRGQTS